MLLLPPANWTKPVIVPLLMTCGSPAIARSDSAPILPPLVRIAVPPPFALKKMPAAGRPDIELMLPAGVTEAGDLPGRRGVAGGVKGIACQPRMIDPPDGMFTVTPPLPPFALIAVPNCPGVDTLLAVTCTGPVIKVIGRPPFVLRSVPLSARIPTASEPSAKI